MIFPPEHVFAGLQQSHYKAILADPAWNFKVWSDKGKNRSAERHYPTMTLEDIKALPVADLAAPDCLLFLWSINSMLPQALEVLTAWQFAFRTVAFTWAKRTKSDQGWHFGLGYYTRQNTESVLLATRGKPKRMSKGVRQLLVAPRREHSRKPSEIHSRIEALVDGPYLELFAREPTINWSTFGDEKDKFKPEIPAPKLLDISHVSL